MKKNLKKNCLTCGKEYLRDKRRSYKQFLAISKYCSYKCMRKRGYYKEVNMSFVNSL